MGRLRMQFIQPGFNGSETASSMNSSISSRTATNGSSRNERVPTPLPDTIMGVSLDCGRGDAINCASTSISSSRIPVPTPRCHPPALQTQRRPASPPRSPEAPATSNVGPLSSIHSSPSSPHTSPHSSESSQPPPSPSTVCDRGETRFTDAEAATKIQAGWRRCVAREKFQAEALVQGFLLARHLAATYIQRAWKLKRVLFFHNGVPSTSSGTSPTPTPNRRSPQSAGCGDSVQPPHYNLSTANSNRSDITRV
eukprot:GHVN01083163.1.p1 GENE.GHVN01083163.1~~GHVN01083163.1.p1  ORF type:complete len:253 (+),score=37.49 GHVN01083163.1:1212-1970(+)